MLDTAGIGTYLAETLPRVLARMGSTPFTLLGPAASLGNLVSGFPNADVVGWEAPVYSAREQLEARRHVPRDTTAFWAPHFNIPLAWSGPLVVTVHDVAFLALAGSTLAQVAYAKAMFSAVRRRASAILFDSAFTAQEFQRRVGTPRHATVCHLGVAAQWFDRASEPSPDRYLLFVGNVKPHKNLGRLIEAFARVAPRIPHRLVIAGRREGLRTVDDSVNRLAAALGRRIDITGYVSSPELERLVAGCDALVLPSLYEGFGLPPLEALACGRPVAVSNVASLPEVCGAEAEYFDPLDVDDMARAIERVACRPADTLDIIERRRAWSRRFDWSVCADVVTAELRRATTAGS